MATKQREGSSSSMGKWAMAAAGAAAAAAGIAYKAFSTDTTVYEVKTHGDGWQVVKSGSDRASSVHDTKKEAVAAARDLAAKKAPSELRIYKTDGDLEDSHSYDVDEN